MQRMLQGSPFRYSSDGRPCPQAWRCAFRRAEAFDLVEGTEIDVRHEAGNIVLVPERRQRGKYTLKQLVTRITRRNRPESVDFGRRKGREIW